ncbi:TonB-dependent receptor domain-containing protein [Chryseobacterium koreense]|uniref:Outer membrane protein beta-barrel domain-containing protein n=1 Tax=Chryseobacterium koreense CCUG 49689 TaxID=1304281 RepID=A0A0J7IZM4_9FLAO|nr:TonB-dependent receptor [Chryseobacterium koreense]KMQ71653.1 hypothetical protein ACM44_05365 [Chryseobacterium koreense CCUG 49689]MBB5333218.1 hypothetical protein [Chryseobacterium koreense]
MKTLILPIFLLAATFSFAQMQDSAKAKTIDEVVMTKKVFQKKADRLVFDVASSPIAKGSNAFDLLKETPMISASDDKTLQILGKNAVLIYLNGRKSNMSPDAVIELLKSMPSENIQKIEVITMPSSEFAVEGNQGIVNIVLKKKPTDGLNGNLKMENNQSYFNSQKASVTLNYRKDKLGISTNFNAGQNNNRQFLSLANGNKDFSQTSAGNIDNFGTNLSGYLNLDFEINEKQNLGFSYNNYTYRSKELHTDLFNVLTNLKTGEIFRNRTENFGNTKSDDHSFNLNYELKTDDKGSKLSISSSYLKHIKKEEITGSTIEQDAQQNNGELLKQFQQNIPLGIDNIGILADYVKKMNNDYTLSFGASFNHTKTDSDTKFTNILPPTGIDLNQSNHFLYTEKIPSAYITLEKNFGEKWTSKAGFRFEKTMSDGIVLDKNITINRDNNSFLPYLSLSYNPNQKHNFSYSFSSRIQRPPFWAIAPNKIYLTETNYIQNNPFAKPETYYNQELMYMYKNAYFLNFSHSYVKDASEQIPLQGINSKDQRVLAYIRTNYGDKQEMTASLGMQKTFFKGIWVANNSAFLGHHLYKGEVAEDPTDTQHEVTFNKNVIDYNTTFYGVNLQNTIRLSSKKDWFLGVNYFYTSSLMIELGKLEPVHGLNLSLKKTMDNWTFNLQVRDVFHTSEIKITGYQNNGDYNIVDQSQYRRRFNFTATYTFGNQKLQKIRNIGGANDDVKNRTGN